MKKSLFFGLVAILGLIGCSRNQEIDIPDANLSLFARTESPAESRTVVESGVHVYWEPGDEIAVFMGEKTAKFTTDITAASGTATFKGTFGDTTWPEDLDLWAVYPFSEDATFDGKTITTTLPSEQIAREGSFGKDMNLAIAHSNSSTLQFYNVGGGIRFSVTEEGIKRVVLSGLGEENLSGQIHMSFQNGIPTYNEGIGMSPYIALSATDDGFVPGEWYFINALPKNLPNGFQLRFYKDGSSGVRVFEKSVEIKRGIFGTVANADTGVEFYQDEMVQGDDDAIEDLINQCIDSEVDVETKREELEALPSVESVEILEMETIVHFVSGEVVYYPYAFPSIFDQEDIAGAAPAPKKTKSKKKAPVKASGYVAADVAIFNLFSEDSGRKNQNKLVENTKAVFERAGKSVHIYGRDDFNIDNLVEAIKSNAIIFVSTLGTTDNRILLGQKKTNIPETYDNLMYINNFHTKKYDGSQRYTTDIIQILNDKHYSGPLVYLASCYTKPNNNSSLNLVGWNGINKVGQAYGLIIADYYATWGKTYQAFSIDFSNDHTPSGTIIDPLETNTKLIHYGNGWSGNGRDGWTELKYDNKVVIDQPTPGTCNKKLKYTVKLSYRNDGNIVTDGKSVTYENGNKYYFEYTNLGDDDNGILWRSDPLRFKDDIVEYKVKNLTPGVWRFLSYPTADDSYYGALKYQDCTYAIFSHSFKENDVQEDDTPSVVTLGTMAGTNDLVLGGAVINRSLAGLETGFEYWKKNAPTNKSTIATSTTYEDYFGAVLQIPDLDGEYEFRAFARDEEGLIGYGDIMILSSSTIPPDGTTNKIYYTTSDGNIVTPYSSICSANIVSNVYSNGKGVITFDSAVTSINDYAFYECSTLTSITIPDGVKSIGYCSFLGCTGLTSISLPDGMISIGCAAFYECISLASIAIPKTVTSIGEGVSIYGVFERCRSLTSITIPEGVTTIEENTFEDCFSLRYVSIPEGVTRIGGWAFWACSFSYLKLPESLRVIGEEAFLNSDLTSITIPEGVTSIEAGAFMAGYHLTSIKILAAVPPTGGADMFRDSYCPIYVPAGSVEAYKTAEFWNNYADRIKPIGGGAFDDDDTYWVDLGLSVKWARFNLGALGEMDYGDYFAWGEITPNKSSFSWETYRWSNGDESSLTKYNYSDGINSLDYEDDPAYQQTGGNWRMPTEAEWRELIENCSWHFNGVYMEGCSNVDGYDAYIYFPLAGKKDGIEWLNDDTVGYYWTSSLSPFSSMGSIGCISTTTQDMGYLERYIGLPIRPVYDGK